MAYLIDGNNLLGSWGGPRAGDDRRGEVVRRVAAFCRARRVKATVVFDGHPLRSDLPAQELGALSVRVPEPGEDADTVVRRLAERAPDRRGLTVVTSDKSLGDYCRSLGCAVLRAHEWNALERQAPAVKASRPDSDKPDREDDVEGWLRRFGGK